MRLGSIAQQVIALGRTPVLLVRPSQKHAAPEFACQRILVPLDGNRDHEQGLRVAAGLAQPCGAALHLLMVVPTVRTLRGQQAASGLFLPGAMSTLLDLDQEAAEAHLTDQVSRLREGGLSATAKVRRGDPARVIARMARRAHADLVVLGTHGRAGMEAFWSDSVAPQVSSEADAPLLLVPVRG